MRWRFVDRIDEIEPWRYIRGAKCVSLEEYDLLKIFGDAGVLPRSLVLECCVELVRWLVAVSSDYRQTAVLAGSSLFHFESDAGMADALAIAASVQEPRSECVEAQCEVRNDRRLLAHGFILLRLLPLAETCDREWVEGMWRELHGAA